MNAMGHDVPTMIGVDHRGLARQITNLIPDYMVMSERGMADMAEMEMPLPDNTIPMMSGQGPFGGLEMGGMFSVLKVRKEQKPGDYTDPGWYVHPAGTVATEYKSPLGEAPRQTQKSSKPNGDGKATKKEIEVKVRKPNSTSGHSGH